MEALCKILPCLLLILSLKAFAAFEERALARPLKDGSCRAGLVPYRDLCLASIRRVPLDVAQNFHLSSFYKKYLPIAGMPVLGSSKVSDRALQEESYIIYHISEFQPQSLNILLQKKFRAAAMAVTEVTTDLPEHADLTPKDYWDVRARGLAASLQRPVTSGAEENLLCQKNDRYRGENIFLHEFSHTIYFAIQWTNEDFHQQIVAAYQNALKKGLWKNTYAITNDDEYFAELSQSWFDANQVGPAEGNGIHNNIATRSQVKSYDPMMASLLKRIYGDGPWRARCPSERLAN